jgi:hypothetical protein
VQRFEQRLGRIVRAGHAHGLGRLHRFLGLDLGHSNTLAVAVEAASRFTAEETGVHQLLLQDRGREARVAKIGLEHRLRDREIDVMADQVHQLERPHAEAAAVAHDRIQRGRIGRLFLQHAQRLGIIGTRHAVDDEARRGFRVHRILAPGFGGGVHGIGDCLVSRDAFDHFDQRHQRHRVKEVHADQALRPLQLRGDGRHRDRRGVGGEDAVRADDAFQLGEQGALDVHVFDDGFDHQRGVLQLAR